MSGLAAGSQLIKLYWGDYQKDCIIVDSRYQQQVNEYLAAIETRQNASRFYWTVFFGVPLVILFYASELKKQQMKAPVELMALAPNTHDEQEIAIPMRRLWSSTQIRPQK